MPIKGKMTEQQRRFCEARVIGLEQGRPAWWAAWQAECCNTKSHIEPSRERVAHLRSRASKLLKYPHVVAYIAALQERRARDREQERRARDREQERSKVPSRPMTVAERWRHYILGPEMARKQLKMLYSPIGEAIISGRFGCL